MGEGTAGSSGGSGGSRSVAYRSAASIYPGAAGNGRPERA